MLKARDVVAAVFGRSGMRRSLDSGGAALPQGFSGEAGNGASSSRSNPRLLSASAGLLTLTLALGVTLAAAVAPVVTVDDAAAADGIPPEVSRSWLTAFEPGDTSMTVLGIVNPNNLETDCRIVYGIGSPSGNEAPCTPAHPATNEEGILWVSAESGQYKLKFGSDITTDLAYDASSATVQQALEALPSIGPGNISLRPSRTLLHNPQYNATFIVTFVGDLAGTDVPAIEALPGTVPLAGSPQKNFGVIYLATEEGTLGKPVPVTAALTDLTPNTEYRFKFVATNAAGSTAGDEQSFTTLRPPQSPQTCSNDAVRAEQHATGAECRAFEMVSPADKNGAPVVGEETNVVAATDGNAASFMSRGGFAGTTGSGRAGFTQYLARREAGGWSTKAITPTPPKSASQVISGGSEIFYFSDDLAKAVMWGYDLPAVNDDLVENDNLYRLDTGTGALQTITLATQKTGPNGLFEFLGSAQFWGASRDTGVVSFAARTRLLPTAAPEVRNAYEWDHGVLRLAGILPNGEVPSGGSAPPGDSGYRQTVSSDGSRVLFASPAEGSQQLYLRKDHTSTAWVSEPESGSATEPEQVELRWVSPDAGEMLFTTTSQLLAEDANSTADLYLYRDGPAPASEPNNLELVTHPGFKFASSRDLVVGASDDAGVIYFMSTIRTISVWDHGDTRPILNVLPPEGDQGYGPMRFPGQARVTSDGRILAFRAPPVEGEDGPGLTGTEVSNTAQMYVYDAAHNTLACASCIRGGSTSSEVPLQPDVNHTGATKSLQGLRPRYLSDDGRLVFFSTPEALEAADTNAVMDTYVYETETGHRHLISSGRGEQGQWFLNASSSGDDAFFGTGERLLGADPDQLTDLYDARIGGGFVEPPPPPSPCAGDNCRGPLSSPASGASPATASFAGPGNPHRKARRHHRKHHKKGKHHKQGKHHKKGKKRHHQRSGGSARNGVGR